MVLPGFNTDFKHKGETYHVQTEDNGAGNPVVVTLLYFKGAILASKRTSYRELLERDSWQKELMELMKSQHREIMRELLDGKLARSGPPAPEAPPPAAPRAPEATRADAPTPAAAPASPPRPARAPRPAPAAAPAPLPPPRVLTLDEAILRYLQQHAARGATAGNQH